MRALINSEAASNCQQNHGKFCKKTGAEAPVLFDV